MKRRNVVLAAVSSISALATSQIASILTSRTQKSEAAPAVPEKFRVIMQRIQQRVQLGPHTRIDPKQSALLLIEFQGEWLNSNGTLRPLLQDRSLLESALVKQLETNAS